MGKGEVINKQTKLRCKSFGSNWYIYNIFIDEEDEAIIVIGEYGKKYGDSLEFHTIKHIRKNYNIWD